MKVTYCDRCGEVINPLDADSFYLNCGLSEYQLCDKCVTDMKREMKEYRKNHSNKTDGDSNVGQTY